MNVPYDEYVEILVMAEKIATEKRSGFVYIRPERLDTAQMLCDKIGVDFIEWVNAYFDYEAYN